MHRPVSFSLTCSEGELVTRDLSHRPSLADRITSRRSQTGWTIREQRCGRGPRSAVATQMGAWKAGTQRVSTTGHQLARTDRDRVGGAFTCPSLFLKATPFLEPHPLVRIVLPDGVSQVLMYIFKYILLF